VEAEAADEASHAGKDDWMCSEQDDPPDQGGQADQGGAGPVSFHGNLVETFKHMSSEPRSAVLRRELGKALDP
jgi:hypothetical protein